MALRRRNVPSPQLSAQAVSNALAVPPLPLQQHVIDERRLLTVPWTLLLQGIEQTIAEPTYFEGSHADRKDPDSDPEKFRMGTFFFETDRKILYQARLVPLIDPAHPTDPPVPVACWVYISGTMRNTLANKPTDLGPTWTNRSDDTGFLFYGTDYTHTWRWTGTAWEYAPGDRASGEIAWFTADPGTGWKLCNGTNTDRSNPNATTTLVATPNLIGVYPKGAGTYTGSVVAASSGTMSGSTGDESSHTHGINHDHPLVTSAETTYNSTFAGGGFEGVSGHHAHNVDLPPYTGTSGAGSAHHHDAGSLSVSGAEPAHVDLLPYFRR